MAVNNSATEVLPELPRITSLSDRVTRILGGNAGPFCLQGTNSYLIGRTGEQNCLLVDTSSPSMPSYIEALEETLLTTNRRISRILLTHWHGDHVGSLEDVKTLCYKLTGSHPAVFKFPTQTTRQSIPVTAEPLTDGMSFSVGNGSLEASDTHIRVIFAPGHTDDHSCFFLEEENVLFSGDIILGHGSTYFEHLTSYLSSLEHLLELSPQFKSIFPGHGAVVNSPTDKIISYITHRRQRIEEILTSLRSAPTEEWFTDDDLLKRVYVDLIPAKTRAALAVQRQALEYLADLGQLDVKKEQDLQMWKYKR